MADQKKGIPNGNQTQFLTGSITKSLTSVVVVKVLNEKFPEMDEDVLDTPIRTLVPSANFTLMDRFRSENGTFRDLLAHRMCIRYDGMAALVAEAFNTSEIVYRQRYAEEVCGIRTEFRYNNEMFVMAGELIGILANQSYETLVKDLLTEIGMLNSTLGKKSDDYSNLPFRAKPYYVMDNVSHPMNTDLLKRIVNSNAVGGLWSTPDDMAKYLSFHLNLGKVGENQVIPESVMKWISKPSILLHGHNFETDTAINWFSYGLGLYRGFYDGWTYLQHSGYIPTFVSLLSLFPSQKIGIFTSSNQSPVLLSQQYLHEYIFALFMGYENATATHIGYIEQTSQPQRNKTSNQTKIHEKCLDQVNVVTSLPNITGQYGSGWLGKIEIFEKFNPETNATGLYLSYGKWAHGWIESYDASNNNDNATNTTEVINLKIFWDTDIAQEYYATGEIEGHIMYTRVDNDTFQFLRPGIDDLVPFETFRLGVSLENEPPIPWNQEGRC